MINKIKRKQKTNEYALPRKQNNKKEDDEDDDDEDEDEDKKNKGKAHKAPGVARQPAAGGNRFTHEDPINEFSDLVRENMKLSGVDRRNAVRMAARQNPELHEDYIRANQKGGTRPELVDQYLDNRRTCLTN